MHQMLATHINKRTRNGTFGKMLEKIEFKFGCKFIKAEVSVSGYAVKRNTPAQYWSGKIDAVAIKIRPNDVPEVFVVDWKTTASTDLAHIADWWENAGTFKVVL